MSVALLFPGQGAQRAGMLADLPKTPAAQAVIAQSHATCEDLGITGPLDAPEYQSDTVAAQLSLLIAGVACGRALLDDKGLTAQYVAGHSVGTFAAAVIAGALTLREALIAVHLRAESMRAVCSERTWAMAAVTGLTTAAAHQLANRAATPDQPVWVANINTATQTVLGGTAPALSDAEQLARRAGATSFTHLDMEIASHGPVQEPTSRALRSHLSTIPRRTLKLRYITNTGGRAVGSAWPVLDDLADSPAQAVRWYDGVRLMAELGVTCTVESLPGHTLTRLVAIAVPVITAAALDEHGLTRTCALATRP
ncbi:ACP S-malonyltransferase [Mycobacterium riyadhense]|uniref:[acyl-carrier-protein] S-malonyltransferase n=1 Tax=Mycobacterium riyadhense TaxID=486698 RepID=A0A1X2CZQ6_9MYCO|nr:acyltransferase domain-containing protein [Mycobacterium riyadhense]MCV7144442.1 acyltransferase domain-containing protein [Mycobacterium riyadhense]ORW81343.1 hypothetical protein AWC22_16820 [Mycobacterium riyadhense]